MPATCRIGGPGCGAVTQGSWAYRRSCRPCRRCGRLSLRRCHGKLARRPQLHKRVESHAARVITGKLLLCPRLFYLDTVLKDAAVVVVDGRTLQRVAYTDDLRKAGCEAIPARLGHLDDLCRVGVVQATGRSGLELDAILGPLLSIVLTVARLGSLGLHGVVIVTVLGVTVSSVYFAWRFHHLIDIPL